MKRVIVSLVAVASAISLGGSLMAFDTVTIAIKVAPNVISLDSHGVVLTVHTDIAYDAVAAGSVTLNGVSIPYWSKEDCQGNFVAKFNLDDVKGMLKVGTVQVTLTGETVDGQVFQGTDTIRVINPRK